MDSTNPQDHPGLDQENESVKRALSLGYGRWLAPVLDGNDIFSAGTQEPESSSSNPEPEPTPAPRRGRGRPRVNATRDASAIEKRRAQVRNAQRTYQKRKDTAASSVNNRCDDLLEVLSDLSTEVEELLNVSSKAGLMGQNSEVAIQIQRLWATYDNVVNRPAVSPDLRLLRVKNDRRRAEHYATDSFRIGIVRPQDQLPERSEMPLPPYLTVGDAASSRPPSLQQLTVQTPLFTASDVEDIDMRDLQREETTLIQSFSHQATQSTNKIMGGRSIFEIVKERQAQYKASQMNNTN